MKIVFLSNYLNHHQKSLCDAFYNLTHGEFRFIAYNQISKERIALGYSDIKEEYLVEGYKKENSELCRKLILEADVVIGGSFPWEVVKERVKEKKLIFKYSERIYRSKKDYLRLIKNIVVYFFRFTIHKNIYCLAASAYTARDYNLSTAFISKVYKWGYFPKTYHYDITELMRKKQHEYLSIIWVGRLIELKHPEYALSVGNKLHQLGVKFRLTMIGIGPLLDLCNKYITDNNLHDCVKMVGAMTPEEVRGYMEASNVFLFTSDKNEGWGAVMNEAMNSGCAVVSSSAIGSVPFLVKHNDNGLIYQDGEQEDLFNKLYSLVENRDLCKRIGERAYHTIVDCWNAELAANRFMLLVESMLQHKTSTWLEGPCSKATYLQDNWWKKANL